MKISCGSWNFRYHRGLRKLLGSDVPEQTNLCWYVQGTLFMSALVLVMAPFVLIGMPIRALIARFDPTFPDEFWIGSAIAGCLFCFFSAAVILVGFALFQLGSGFMWAAGTYTGITLGLTMAGILAPLLIYRFKGYICPIITFEQEPDES